MSMDLFDHTMKQAIELYEHIGLSNLGEFLCDKQFNERAAVFKHYMDRRPEVWFDQVTNATLLDEEHLAPLAGLKNPVLYVLSIDAVDPLISYAIRPPGLATQAQENIRNINATHERLGLQKPQIIVSVTLLKRNLLDCFNIISFAREVGCAVYFRHAMGQGLAINNKESLFRVPAFSNKILKRCQEFGKSQGVKVTFEPLFAETENEIELYHTERADKSIPCRIFNERYISKIDINGDYTCCYNLERIHGNVQETPLSLLMDHNDNFITKFLGKPIPPCTLCRGRQMQLSFIHESSVYDLEIPSEERCYNPDIDMEEHGFFDWINEIDQVKAGIQLRRHWNTIFGTRNKKTIISFSCEKKPSSKAPFFAMSNIPQFGTHNEPNDTIKRLLLDADNYKKKGHYVQAFKVLERLLAENPANDDVINQLNEMRIELGIPLCISKVQ